MFNNCGIIQFEKSKISEEEAFEISINAGAKDCLNLKENFEIITEKEDFYKIKTELEKKIDTFSYSAIEWRAINYIDLDKEQADKILEILSALEELDDVQNIFTNANLEKINI
jgi:transcriptional/translational regulatory protein YebC/TACO1